MSYSITNDSIYFFMVDHGPTPTDSFIATVYYF